MSQEELEDTNATGASGSDGSGSDVKETVCSHESVQPLSQYITKPPLEEKFKGLPIKEIILQELAKVLSGKSYDTEGAKKWTHTIANSINQEIKELQMKRYKHIVQVTVGELKGQGVKSGLRCLWDSETDSYTHEIFMNDTIFAVVVVFGIYLY